MTRPSAATLRTLTAPGLLNTTKPSSAQRYQTGTRWGAAVRTDRRQPGDRRRAQALAELRGRRDGAPGDVPVDCSLHGHRAIPPLASPVRPASTQIVATRAARRTPTAMALSEVARVVSGHRHPSAPTMAPCLPPAPIRTIAGRPAERPSCWPVAASSGSAGRSVSCSDCGMPAWRRPAGTGSSGRRRAPSWARRSGRRTDWSASRPPTGSPTARSSPSTWRAWTPTRSRGSTRSGSGTGRARIRPRARRSVASPGRP